MAITLTEAAVQHVKRELDKRGAGIGIRLGVRSAGCSGMAYVLDFIDEIAPSDHSFEYQGLTVVVDPTSLAYVDGTELDFHKQGLKEAFTFKNPKVAVQCGCGESFNI